MRALIVDDELGTPTAEGRAARALVRRCRAAPSKSSRRPPPKTARSVITSDSAIHAMLIDWTLGDDDEDHTRARALPASSSARATTRSRSS